MKKLFTASIMLWFAFTAFGQTKLNESFEGAQFPPPGWQSIDPSGGTNWQMSSSNSHAGSQSAFIDYDCGTVDFDWLITPKLSIVAHDTLKFWMDPLDFNYPDSFTVKASLTDSLLTSFTITIGAYKDPLISGAGFTNYINGWQQIIIPLDSATFHGKNVFFAIKHWDDCGDGIFIDQFFVGQPSPPCSGSPSAGSPFSSTVLVCNGSTTSLTISGATEGAGTTYQWQQSFDNGVLDPWNPVSGGSGATTTTYTTPGITAGRYYRLLTTCTTSAQSVTTSAIYVGIDSFYNCYCSPGVNGSCWDGAINGVSITGGSLFNNSGCNFSGPYFTKFPASLTTDTVLTGENIQINIDAGTTSDQYAVWIDYNRNGIYESSEYNLITNNSSFGVNSANITIPTTAATGLTGMRVRGTGTWNGMGGNSVCTSYWDGESEEYLIRIEPAPPCTGSPNAGIINDSIKGVCTGNVGVLQPFGSTVASQIVYQWEESDDNGNLDPWANTSASDTAITFTTPVITSNFTKYYRLRVTCLASTQTSYSNVAVVFADSFYNCYCKADLITTGSCWNGSIQAVSITNGTLNNSTWCSGPPYYNYYPIGAGTVDTVQTGEAIQINITSPNSADQYGVWIDYNRNGSFESTEFTSVTTSSVNGVNSKYINIPNNAPTGRTAIRIRGTSQWNTLNGFSACSMIWDGETEDYAFFIEPAPPCSGTPSGGTLAANTALCNGNSAILQPTGVTVANQLAFQWEESDDDGTLDPWANTAVADTNSSLNTPVITPGFAKYYRLKVTCLATSQFAYSNSTKVFSDSFYNCYCKADLITTGSCWSGAINSVSITNGNLNNTTFCSGPPYYNNYAAGPGTSDTVQTGETIQLNVNSNGTQNQYGAWIDYNRNGVFEFSEYHSITTNSINGNNSINISIPTNAPTGRTGLRIRGTSQWNTLNGGSACSMIWDGETEDYAFFIEPAPPCSGTPSGGTLPATLGRCSGTSALLLPSGVTIANELAFQWEESDDDGALDPWANTAVADTNNTLNTPVVTPGFVKYYRLKVTCLATSQFAYSTSTRVFADSFYNCYANTGPNGSCWDGAIDNVSITGGTLNNTTFCNFGTYFTTYGIGPNTADTVLTGQNIQFNLSTNTTQDIFGVWIDYNHSGTFDFNEYKEITSNSINGLHSVNILIPATAMTGRTGMRVRGTGGWNGMGAGNATTYYWDGETEDYAFFIEPAPVCTGTPNAGTLPAVTASCVNNVVNLTPSGTSVENQLFYQWEESDDDGNIDPWANTSAADTNITFTSGLIPNGFVKYYRLKVTCLATSQFAYSTSTKVFADSFYNCYQSTGVNGSCWSGPINSVSITGGTINMVTNCNFGGPWFTSHPYVTGAVDTLMGGQNIQLNVSASNTNDHYGVWIDYNHSGTYDFNEYTQITTNSVSGVNSVNITIPPTMLLGRTGMRVRGTSQWNGMNGSSATTNFWDGETEDFWLFIEQAPLCSGTPNAGTTNDTLVAVCAPSTYIVNVTGLSIASGIQYQWEESDDNGVLDPWAITNVADSGTTYNTASIVATKWLRLRSTCTASSITSYSNAIKIVINPPTQCYCTSNLGGWCGGFNITNVKINGTSFENTSACTMVGSNAYASYYTAGGTATAHLSRGVTYPISVTSSGNSLISVWIDANANGIFETSEWQQISTSSTANVPSTANFTIPLGAVTGQTGMRVRTNASWNWNGPGDACTNFWDGETEDYLVTIGDITTPPTTQASAVTAPTVNANSLVVNWNRGNGARCIVVAKLAATTAVNPTNGLGYTASNFYGAGDMVAAGQYVVYNGTGSSVTVFGLSNNTNYEFLVYEFNQNGNAYLTPGASSGTITTPVKLVSFAGKKANADAVLTWITASEENNRGFEILRSFDGRTFSKIDFVKGAGTTTATQRYSYIDRSVFNAGTQVYYKLRQVDFDGKFAFSEVVTLKADEKTSDLIVTYPNPFNNVLNIDITSNVNGKATIEVADISGRTILSMNKDVTEGSNTITLNQMSELTKGVYFVRVTNHGETKVFKMIKE